MVTALSAQTEPLTIKQSYMLADFVNELELQHPPEVGEISVPGIVLFKANMIQELLMCSLGIYLTRICQTFFFKA